MTADTTLSGSVLLVFQRARVMDEVADVLRRMGLHVREETDAARARAEVDGATVDVLAVGRSVKPDRRNELVRTLRSRNPELQVVHAMAPITEVLVAQVQEALTSPEPAGRVVATAALETVNSRVVVVLRRAADTTVDLYRLDTFYRAHQLRVHDGPLVKGRNYLHIRGRFARGDRFLVVQADGETSVHAVP
ncbi:MAG: hypothetical protein ACODAF_09980 [Actinomycetota bacterium]